jgi:hypothetical protein
LHSFPLETLLVSSVQFVANLDHEPTRSLDILLGCATGHPATNDVQGLARPGLLRAFDLKKR